MLLRGVAMVTMATDLKDMKKPVSLDFLLMFEIYRNLVYIHHLNISSL